jgi:formylglycine-generating enzyme required for sulfatase activity
MKRIALLGLCLAFAATLLGARKALVIGNADYADKKLANTLNDAREVAKSLRGLGFEVTQKSDLDKEAFETAIDDFGRGLGSADEAVFFYAGHGIQVEGLNYLLPIGTRIEKENQVKYRAVDCNYILESLQAAGVSIVILDACRNNPYTWKRSETRGLARMEGKPGSQYIIYSTAAGSEADDGDGANSPFTTALVQNLTKPGLVVEEMMRSLIKDVEKATGDRQTPASYGNLKEPFYFAGPTVPLSPLTTASDPQSQVILSYGSILVSSNADAEVYLDGILRGTVPAGALLKLSPVQTGNRQLELRGPIRTLYRGVTVEKDRECSVEFEFPLPPPGFVLVEEGYYDMGSEDHGAAEKPVHSVYVSSFYIGKFELTHKEWDEVMGEGETGNGGENLPVVNITWYNSLDYCNLRSIDEGLTPCYSIDYVTIDQGNLCPEDAVKPTVTVDWNANGYRLPTEAEWEYAAKGGKYQSGFTYSGSDDTFAVAWFAGSAVEGIQPGGGKLPNALGIYDMSGNVSEMCWDWCNEGYYGTSPYYNPPGPEVGFYRALRGGSLDNDDFCRVTARDSCVPNYAYSTVGFRLVRKAD